MSHLVEQLKEQRKIEQGHAKDLKPSVAKAQNKLVAALLEGIMLDSMKHAAICEALIDVNAGEMPASKDIDVGVADLHQDVRQHIKVEADMLTRLGVMAREAKDRHVKAMLQHILEDEKRHHSTLQALSNLMDRDNAGLEDYLEILQKYMVVPR